MPELTESQRAAVEHGEGNLQIIACAGSGKTEVVAQRVAFLLDPNTSPSLKPNQIVAFTFTNKAASELKQRIVRRVLERMPQAHGLSDLFVGTIHGYCLDLLQQHDSRYENHEVLSAHKQHLLIDRFSRQCGLTLSGTLGGSPLKRWTDTKVYAEALSLLRESKLRPNFPHNNSIARQLPAYLEVLEKQRYLDYTSVLAQAVDLVSARSQTPNNAAAQVKYLIVDEYQDINPIQEELIGSLHERGATLCVVGDDDQSIYHWRGADTSKIIEFSDRYPNVTSVTLDLNFRSSVGITETADGMISAKRALPKHMKSNESQTIEPGDITALRFPDAWGEASWIAQACKQLHGVAINEADGSRGLTWSDIAVLVRRRRDMVPIAEALSESEIPHTVQQSGISFENPILRALRWTFHAMSSIDVIGRGERRPSPDREEVRAAWSHVDAAITPASLDSIETLIAGMREESGSTDTFSKPKTQGYLPRILFSILEALDLDESAVSPEQWDHALYSIGLFSQIAEEYDAIHHATNPVELLEGFAKHLYFQAPSYGPDDSRLHVQQAPNAVRVMTIHQAKGMEWPAVFLPALSDGIFPSTGGGGRTVWHLIPQGQIVDGNRYDTTEEDELRLFYVAMTRSKKFLHMTRSSFDISDRNRNPSPFFERVQRSRWVSTERPDYSQRSRETPRAAPGSELVDLSFSELKQFLQCPHEFKLRKAFGVQPPEDNIFALGYGHGLHETLAEAHRLMRNGSEADELDVSGLVENHMQSSPRAPKPSSELLQHAKKIVGHYLKDRADRLADVEFVEKDVEARVAPDVNIRGRIDFVRHTGTGEVTITDLKSTKRSQADDANELQLFSYAIGYEQLTGRRPAFVEIYDLEGRKSRLWNVTAERLQVERERARLAADAIRRGDFAAKPEVNKCKRCKLSSMCRSGRKVLDARPRIPLPDRRGD